MVARSSPTAPPAPQPPSELRQFLAEDWQRWIAEYPELGTVVGAVGFNDRWTDDSPEGIERRLGRLRDSAARFHALERSSISPADQLNYDLYAELLATAKRGVEFGDEPLPYRFGMPHNLWMPLNQMEGVHLAGPEILELQPRGTRADYRDLLSRLHRLPAAIDQNIALLKRGMARGYSPPRIALRGVPAQVQGLTPTDPLESPLLKPFAEFSPRISAADRASLAGEARAVFEDEIVPAVGRLLEYLTGEYLPACRESVGASSLPDGPTVYAYRVAHQTTTTLTPEEVHTIGLSEVKRIREAMHALIASTGFSGTFEEFTTFLRTDRRFFYDSGDDLVNGYRVIGKKVDPELGRLFGRLPRLPYGVQAVPSFRAAASPTAYYISGAPATGRPGYFFANTFDLKARPKWEMEALALHEAVPGHHLQITIAQELEDLPEFRQNSGYTAFVEGWGLYAESLGEEVGLYRDPYSKMGQLIYDMWRSIRLVVDTGLHAMGWSRDQAIQLFRENTGKSEVDMAVEVDRYIVWPGQALAYKIGQLKIRELRTFAERELGERFDERGYHDLVLGEGAVPLGVLEARVRAWVDRLRAVPGHGLGS